MRARIRPSLLLSIVLLQPAASAAAGDVAMDRAYLPKLENHEQFKAFSVTLNGAPYTKFVIEAKSDKIHYFWTHGFAFHYDFVTGVLLGGDTTSVGTIEEFNDKNHISPDRDYILGTVAYHPTQKVYAFEFLAADVPPAEIIQKTYSKLQETFFDKGLLWRPVGEEQKKLKEKVQGVPVVGRGMMDVSGTYQFLNAGKAVGKLHVVPEGEDPSKAEYGRDTILVLQELPIDITPCAGVISRDFSTPLSHINLRARAWGIPNIGVADALEVSKGLEGKWVMLHARHEKYELREATKDEIEEAKARLKRSGGQIQIPMINLKLKGLPDLDKLRAWNASAVGAKAANLGELRRFRTEAFDVPPGFAIPFTHYRGFLKANRLDKRIRKLLRNKKLRKSKRFREKELTKLREAIQKGRHAAAFKKAFLAKVNAEPYAGKGLFVRSSTNAEDLHGFNGAGLYTTKPNVKGDAALLEAVKTVWPRSGTCGPSTSVRSIGSSTTPARRGSSCRWASTRRRPAS